ncbi:hypothetical protein EOL70_13390 [Leucothrix sargassi]|nr:hypothetical protein EOL70_13390 [Leucothrix sargassi]
MIILKRLLGASKAWLWAGVLVLVALAGYRKQVQEIEKQSHAAANAEAEKDSILETVDVIKEVHEVRDAVGDFSDRDVDQQLLDNGWTRDDDEAHF